jgi:GNAT superfamily N-acetyltransferase
MNGVDAHETVPLLDETQCQELASFLAERIYEFNAAATGYVDGKLLAGSIRSDAGEVIAGFTGHTWGGCCEISYVWVRDGHRGRGLGRALLRAAETEAQRRSCVQVVLLTHSFQAPEFYERLGYERRYAIEGRPMGHSDIVYVKLLRDENGT